MGGTKILAAAINSNEGIIARVKKATEKSTNPNSYVKTIAKVIGELIEIAKLKPANIKAVCLGVPGLVNPITGWIAVAPNLGFRNFNMKAKLEKLIPYPVLIENDVNLGALGIKFFGLGKAAKDILVVFVGTGIGAGFILDGKIFRGANYAAGEIGHIHIKDNGPVCGCGKKGCFEAVASRTAVTKAILKEIKNKKKSVLSKYITPRKQIKSKALANAVKAGDKIAIKHITIACKDIGSVLGSITNLLNLDMIILGGGLIEALDHFMLPIIKASFRETVLKDSAKGLKIAATKLGDDAALYGGIALAEEFLGIKI
jgi:glucokinase